MGLCEEAKAWPGILMTSDTLCLSVRVCAGVGERMCVCVSVSECKFARTCVQASHVWNDN